jgi:hypothetical protein
MSASASSWVEKVHPLSRGVEADDPMELVATPACGDPDVMLEAFVQEFAQMGFGADELYQMFRSPAYPVLHQLGDYLGEPELRRKIDELVTRTGVFRFQETIVEEIELDEDEHGELIPLTVRSRAC